jgi:hypothetical protein
VQATPADIVQNAGDTWDDLMVKISGTPTGEVESLALLYPYASFRRGQNIFAADSPATIQHHERASVHSAERGHHEVLRLWRWLRTRHFFPAAWKSPACAKTIRLWSAAGKPLHRGRISAFSDWSAFNAAGILKLELHGGVGSAGERRGMGSSTEDGWAISFGLNLKYQKDAAIGTVQAFIQGETVLAKCRALNVTATDIIAAHPIQGTGAARGKRIASGNNLVFTGDGGTPVITLTSAQLRSPGYRFGNDEIRNGELGFEAQRIYTTGQPQPLYTFA